MAKENIVNMFGKRLNDAMNAKGIKAPKLAEKLGYNSASTVYDFVNSRKEPRNFQDLINIAYALSCSTDYLLGLDDAPTHEVASVCRQTGLSERAVNVLGQAQESVSIEPLSTDGYIIDFINDLLTSKELERLSLSYIDWMNRVKDALKAPALVQEKYKQFRDKYYNYDEEQDLWEVKEEFKNHNGEFPYKDEYYNAGVSVLMRRSEIRNYEYIESGVRYFMMNLFEKFLTEKAEEIKQDFEKEGAADNNG